MSPSRKNYYGGALMVLTGVSAAYAGSTYNIGTLARMGPGFFPCALGVLLAITGLLIALSGRSGDVGAGPELPVAGHSHGLPDLRGFVCIVAGVVAFELFGEYLGLLPATFAIVFISALGDRDNTVGKSALLALAMVGVAVTVFHWGLQLQLPLFRWGA